MDERETTSMQHHTSASLFVLKEGDLFLVADARGDILGQQDGLFHHDTRMLSELRLTLGGVQPSLLSSAVSQDNVFFTAHLTNHPLPQGVVHIERKRFLWHDRVYERILLNNHSDTPVQVPLMLTFAADFRDMFEVRGQQREQRGQLRPLRVEQQRVEMAYEGLDHQLRTTSLNFSLPPRRLDAHRAEFLIDIAGHGYQEVYLEIGPERSTPSRERYRRAAAAARRMMRRRSRRGARLQASGRLFQAWLDKSRMDLALLTTELEEGPYPYAGIPWFSTPFGRDAIITALQTLWLDPELARGVLAFLAKNQAEEDSTFRDAQPGKIMHETRKGEMSAINELPFGRYYGGVDTTPLFLMLAGAYVQRTGNDAFITTIWPALMRAASWLERMVETSPRELVEYARGEVSGLLNQGWKDSHDSVFDEQGNMVQGPIALIEVQGYAYRAWLEMAGLARRRGLAEQAEKWEQRADKLRQAVETRFWLEERQFYALALDGQGNPCGVRASNAGHLLYCGLPAPERAQATGKQLLSRAFNSGWGIRTLAVEAARYNPMSYHNGSVWPHDVALCAAGLARYGERDGVMHLLSSLFEAAVYFDMRLPELFCGFERDPGEAPIAYPVACLPQAWASGSVFMLMQACLGITIDGRRETVTVEQPRLPVGIDCLQIRRLAVGDSLLDLTFQRLGAQVVVSVEQRQGKAVVNVSLGGEGQRLT